MQEIAEFSTGTTLVNLLRYPSDPQAWERFVKRYGGVIYSWCLRKRLQPHDAEDVVQGVLLVWFQAIKKFTYRPSEGTFRAWLFTVTGHALADYWGKRKRSVVECLPGSDLSIAEAPKELREILEEKFDLELLDLARKQVQLLVSRRDWDIYAALTENGRSVAEVAAEHNISQMAVRQVRYRVQKKLREKTRRLEDPPE